MPGRCIRPHSGEVVGRSSRRYQQLRPLPTERDGSNWCDAALPAIAAIAIATGLCWASYQFVLSQREGGAILALGIARSVVQLVMPFGFLMIAIRAIVGAGPRVTQRLAAALFLLIPLGDRSSGNLAFVNAVARKNVELTMVSIREKSTVLRNLESQKAILISGAMYNLETASVGFLA